MKRLIVNADDLGMSDSITAGILEAHQEGIVTSSTVMVNMPAARSGLELAQSEAPELGLGLHFNLSYGQPLSKAKEVPSLVRSNGQFATVTWGLGLPHRLREKDVRTELYAQFERFTELAGQLPDHLDSHQLIGTLSAECREVMLDLAEQYDLPLRLGGRALFSKFEHEFASWGGLQKTLAPSLFKAYPFKRHDHIFDRMAQSPDYFDYRFHSKRATVEQLLVILETLPEGVTELVCHPGYSGGMADSYAYREAELHVLKDARIKAKIAELGIVLTHFGTL